MFTEFTEKECRILRSFVEGEIYNLDAENFAPELGGMETNGSLDYLLTLETIRYKLGAFSADDIENPVISDICFKC